MFSSSVAGGSICLRCQLRAVTRRAIPSVAAAQIRGRRRQYASEATKPDSQEDELVAILRSQAHDESRQKHQPSSNWAPDEQEQQKTSRQASVFRTCPDCREVFNTKQLLQRHKNRGLCAAQSKVKTNEPSAQEENQENGRSHESDQSPEPAVESGVNEGTESRPLVRRTYQNNKMVAENAPIIEAPKKKYRRGNMKLEADASKLAIDTLGKPAEVLVLRDSGEWKRKALPIVKNPGEDAQSSLAIEEFLLEEEGQSPDSYLRFLHGMKPQQKILPAREFKSLYDELLAGFTSLQLEKYVEWHREGQPLEEIEDHDLDEEYVISEDDVVAENDIVAEDTTLAEDVNVTEGITEDATAGENSAETEDDVFDEDIVAAEDQTSPSSLFDKAIKYPWMVSEAHWSPEVAGAIKETDYPLRGYVLKSMRPKQRLAIQLMRECWGVSAQELQDGNGSMDVLVRDLEFELLTLGTQRFLQKISRILLKPVGRLEIIRSQNLIRIVAPKAIAETCVNALDETLKRIKTKSFPLHQVPMQDLDAGMLAELGSITNSVVQFDSSHQEIQVSWIDIRDGESQSDKIEDLGDVIFRLLLTAHTSASTTKTLTVYPEPEGRGRFLEDFSDKNKLSWIDRRREWARLCLPLTSGKSHVATAWPLTTDVLKYRIQPAAEDLILPTSTLKPKIDAFYKNFTFPRPLEGEPLGIPKPRVDQPEEPELTHVEGLELTKPTISGWLPFKVSTNAVFGHILHQNSPSLVQALSQPTTALANWPRALSPLIPPVANMSLPGWVPYGETGTGNSTILMRFVPYTESAANAHKGSSPQSPRPPHLELRLLASADSDDLEAHSLRAISQTSISDIILPAEHVDVRATQRLYAELPGAAIHAAAGMAPLAEFLRDARLEPSRGSLVTPPRLRDLGLPGWLARGHGDLSAAARLRQGLPPAAPGGDADAPENEVAPASYVFAGLEVHRTLATTYDGWRLVYTSVEAGQGGGRRAELSLEAVPGYDGALRRRGDAISSTYFLRSMYQLARGLKGHVVEGPDGEEVRTSISWVDQGDRAGA
ncbi:hypothetical protein VPNG_03536 [Cytospora leucostoma]|uniref:Uncharacterized protein n=1 Tax=Cytospora leucostoma TaxID=1230097 RepID=A0A423XCT1_9PEZI|nr:hypothetical protein VPNG_03536 [Cytospora leucostoma]